MNKRNYGGAASVGPVELDLGVVPGPLAKALKQEEGSTPSLEKSVSWEPNGFCIPRRNLRTMKEIARKTLEHLPLTFSSSDFGMGRKVFFPIPLKRKPIMTSDFLYVFADLSLPHEPKEADLGFTEDDVINATGVYVFKEVRERIYGQVLPLIALLRDLTDLSLRNRVICRVNEMLEMVRLDDEFLDEANAALAASGYGAAEFRLH
jgi:hypothetical protein